MKPKHEWFVAVGLVVLIFILLCTVAGCTVTPKQVKSRTVAFDGNEQTGGFVGWDTDGRAIVTERGLDKYRDLLGKYGRQLSPPKTNLSDGVTGPTRVWRLSKEAAADYLIMNLWRNSNRPTNP